MRKQCFFSNFLRISFAWKYIQRELKTRDILKSTEIISYYEICEYTKVVYRILHFMMNSQWKINILIFKENLY